MALATPVATGPADPRVEDAAAVETDAIPQALDEIVQFAVGLARADLVHDLVGHRNERAGIVRQGGFRHQDQRFARLEPRDDLGGGLASRELAEELLDVLNLERSAFDWILLDQVFHWVQRL